MLTPSQVILIFVKIIEMHPDFTDLEFENSLIKEFTELHFEWLIGSFSKWHFT